METPNLSLLTDLIKSRQTDYELRKVAVKSKIVAGLIVLASDFLAILISLGLAVLARDAIGEARVDYSLYYQILPIILPIFALSMFSRNLYPGFGADVITELKTIVYSVSIGFAIIAVLSFLIKGSWEYSRLIFLFSWLLTLFLVPLFRSAAKNYFGKKEWWGLPVLIIGAGKTGERIVKALRGNPRIGLRPYVIFDDDPDKWGYIKGVPVIGGIDLAEKVAKKLNVNYAILAIPQASQKVRKKIVEKFSSKFETLLVAPDIASVSSLWTSPKNLGGVIGFEIEQKLLKKAPQFFKRAADIVLGTFFGLLALPLIIIIAVCIALDSKGGVFFSQVRMGKNDTRFKIVKFRTMRIDAEERLKEFLEKDPKLRAEYEITHKLKNDPRLTRIGKILRKFSLDELPQFWNVIKGDMSLMGPRAYMPWEKVKMLGLDQTILKVRPGITGLWQVTSNINASFEERVYTDVYYVRNWSIFLDVYIFFRTLSVIVLGKNS